MYVRPEEIANLCAIYSELREEEIPSAQLTKHLQRSMPIDGPSSPSVIVEYAVASDLIKRSGGSYSITPRGRGLAKRQGQVSHCISDSAREFMLKKVYLDPASRGTECAEFISRFEVDTVLKSFVLYRNRAESNEDISRMKAFARLGFLRIDRRIAVIDPMYLPIVNALLCGLRQAQLPEVATSSAERRDVGNLAEERALEYERQRLSKLEHRDLVPLVRRISLVDTSVGYDIASFRGVGRNPEKPIYIEVKGTKKAEVDFIWTWNERRVAAMAGKGYWLYVYTDVDVEKKTVRGPTRINHPMSALKARGFEMQPLDIHVFKA
jgi:hypothetical protein